MPGVEAFKLFGVIEINKGQVTADLKTVEGAVNKTAVTVDAKFQDLGRSLRSIGMMVGVPLAAAATGLVKLASSTADYAKDLGNQADMTGLTIQQLQEYDFIAKSNRISTEALTNASTFLQRSLMGIEQGTGNAAKVLKDLGIEVRDTSTGALRPMSILLPEIISKLQGMTKETERNSYMAQLFGRGWKEMAPLIALGAQEMEKQRQAAHDLGIVWSTEMYTAAIKTHEQFDLLTARLQGMTVAIVGALLPNMETLVGKISDVVAGFGAWTKAHPRLTNSLLNLTLAVGALSAVLTPILIALPTLISLASTLLPIIAPNLVFAFGAFTGKAAKLGEALIFLAKPAGALALATIAFAGLTYAVSQLVDAWLDYQKAIHAPPGAELSEVVLLRQQIDKARETLKFWKEDVANPANFQGGIIDPNVRQEIDRQEKALAKLQARLDKMQGKTAPLVGAVTFDQYQKERQQIGDLARLNAWSAARQLGSLRVLDATYASVLKDQLTAHADLHAAIRALEKQTADERKARADDLKAQTKQGFDDAVFLFESFVQRQKDLGKELAPTEIAAGYERLIQQFKAFLETKEGFREFITLQHNQNEALGTTAKKVEDFGDPLQVYTDRVRAASDAQNRWLFDLGEFVQSDIVAGYLGFLDTATAKANRLTDLQQKVADLEKEVASLATGTGAWADATRDLRNAQDDLNRALARVGPKGSVGKEGGLSTYEQKMQDIWAAEDALAAHNAGITARIEQQWADLGRGIQDSLFNAFEDWRVRGESIWQSFMQSIGDMFAQMVQRMIASDLAQRLTSALQGVFSSAASAQVPQAQAQAAGAMQQAADTLSPSLKAFSAAARALPVPLGQWVGAAAQAVLGAVLGQKSAATQVAASGMGEAAALTNAAAGGVMQFAATAMLSAAATMMAAAMMNSASKAFFGFFGAEGAVVTRPTLSLIGEAGPEALVPLHNAPGASRLPVGTAGGSPQVVIEKGAIALSVDSLTEYQLHRLADRIYDKIGVRLGRNVLLGVSG